jgi:AcrR family transcriptional regulator
MANRETALREILATAAECFMEQGFHATSIDDVARRMGATKGRIYHHYASKLDLFFDIHRHGMQLLFDAVEPACRDDGNGVEVLAAMLHAHAGALLEHHAFESVVVQGVHLHRYGALTPAQRAVLDDLIASRDRFESLFKAQVARVQADGHLTGLDVSIATKTMLGGLQWSLVWYRPEIDATPTGRARLASQMVGTLMQGLGVAPR